MRIHKENSQYTKIKWKKTHTHKKKKKAWIEQNSQESDNRTSFWVNAFKVFYNFEWNDYKWEEKLLFIVNILVKKLIWLY